jgi:hypothetical protein
MLECPECPLLPPTQLPCVERMVARMDGWLYQVSPPHVSSLYPPPALLSCHPCPSYSLGCAKHNLMFLTVPDCWPPHTCVEPGVPINKVRRIMPTWWNAGKCFCLRNPVVEGVKRHRASLCLHDHRVLAETHALAKTHRGTNLGQCATLRWAACSWLFNALPMPVALDSRSHTSVGKHTGGYLTRDKVEENARNMEVLQSPARHLCALSRSSKHASRLVTSPALRFYFFAFCWNRWVGTLVGRHAYDLGGCCWWWWVSRDRQGQCIHSVAAGAPSVHHTNHGYLSDHHPFLARMGFRTAMVMATTS